MDARLTMDSSDTGSAHELMRLARFAQREERLPFTVRAVTTAAQLGKAVAVRHRAYDRHVPAFAEQLRRPEPMDLANGCAVLVAESRLDGEPLGTLRIQTNRFGPLALEGSATLPRRLGARSLAEAARLGVAQGRIGHLVRTSLFKAFYLYCVSAEVEWMVITARAPLERMYEALLFSDVFPGEPPKPIKHVGNIPHRILSFEVETAESRWLAARHPLYDFVFKTHHPDIDVALPEEALAMARSPEPRAALAA